MRPEIVVGCLLPALGALVLYLGTMGSGLTWAPTGIDSAELAAAAQVMGVAHPPGYPAYVILARLAAAVAPGSPAQRVAILSAVSLSVAVGLVGLLVLRLLPPGGGRARTWAAAGAAAVAAVAPQVWFQAQIVEVYAVAALWSVAGLLGLLALLDSPGPRLTLVLGAFLGFGLGIHYTVGVPVLLAVGMLAARRRWRLLLPLAGGLLSGLLVFLYLPLRAAAHPPINWGQADTTEGLAWLVTASLYRSLLLEGDWWGRLLQLPAWLLGQLGPWGSALALAGAVWLLHRRRAQAWILLALGVLLAAWGVVYGAPDGVAHLLPLLLVLAALAGVGLYALSVAMPRWRGVPVLLLLVLVAGKAAFDAPGVVQRGKDDVGAWLEAAADDAPPGALLLSADERYVFALWYLQHGLGERGDLAVVAQGLLHQPWYRQQIARRYGFVLDRDTPHPDVHAVQLALSQADARPVLTTEPQPALAGAFELRPAGVLYRLIPRSR